VQIDKVQAPGRGDVICPCQQPVECIVIEVMGQAVDKEAIHRGEVVHDESSSISLSELWTEGLHRSGNILASTSIPRYSVPANTLAFVPGPQPISRTRRNKLGSFLARNGPSFWFTNGACQSAYTCG
jgi:hypothetical protein